MLTLARITNHIVSFMHPQFPEAREVDEEIIHTLSNLQKIFPQWVICTCRFMHKNFFYASDNYQDVLGLPAETLITTLQLEQYLRRLHPADVTDFSRCIDMISEAVMKEPPEERHLLRFVFNYRIQHADGRYIYVHDEKAMLLLKNNQHLYYMLLRDISGEACFSGVRLTIYKAGSNYRKVLEYHAALQAVGRLSPREQEMVPLMKQGLSIKEIAHRLGISPHTVRNLRQKLFEKFQVNNAIELLNKVDPVVAKAAHMTTITAKDLQLAPAV